MPMMPRIDTSTRRVEVMPEKQYTRSVAGEIGRELGSAGRALGGAMERIDAVREREAERQRVLAERNARAADADARRSAELNDALAENFIANAAVGREVVDEATGERRFVPGKFAKTWSEMKAEGTDSVKLTRDILSEMREEEWYKKMDPAVRAHFDRKFLFTRDRWMRRAAENDMKARQTDRVETMKALIAERARGVEGVYGADDATFLAAATRASFQNFLDLESSAIENVDQFDDVQITAANAKEIFAQIKWRENISDEEKVKKYNRILAGVGEFAVNRITALTKAAAKGQGLGAMDAEQCLEKAGDIADGLRETFFIGNNPATGKPREILTEAQHGAILGEIEVARRNCEGIKAYETRKKREEKIRDVVKSELSIRDVPQEQWANNYETLGRDPVLRELDPQLALAYLDTARELREAQAKFKAKGGKVAKERQKATEERLAAQLTLSEFMQLDGSLSQDEENLAQANIWSDFRLAVMKGEVSEQFIRSFQDRLQKGLSEQERRAMRKFYSAFGYNGEIDSRGHIPTGEQKENAGVEFYRPQGDVDHTGSAWNGTSGRDLFAYGDSLLRTIRNLDPGVNREAIIDAEIARLKKEDRAHSYSWFRDKAVEEVMTSMRELKTRNAEVLLQMQDEAKKKKAEEDSKKESKEEK